MGDIELFKNAFQVEFPVEVANLVLSRISDLYGTEFSKKYHGYSDSELQQLTCTVLSGLTPEDIQRGLLRMNSEEWCPNLPKFRSWCEQGGEWWTAEMAWAKALQFEADPTTKITKLAKHTLDEVRHVLVAEGQRAAHFAFKDIYQDYLRRAKDQGKAQEFYVKPPEPKRLGFDESKRNCVPCPPEFVAQLRGINSLNKGGVA
ncbi:restriction endonuclease [Acinetobacter sp. ANC 4558]|uniref:restriction endonuclease n=1 Tax=Acinetobacter sp. ANC 4558 TaxID=1977876 RepID=UPI000A32E5DB|nr:restriction endonuclease [Acinetobacter sp. ANC 4558]OTG85848.1 restriction endonuclease [Acinetobacter sp. ANC 4558]